MELFNGKCFEALLALVEYKNAFDCDGSCQIEQWGRPNCRKALDPLQKIM
jgi:hypothetical protein